jgi:hypothetical protein
VAAERFWLGMSCAGIEPHDARKGEERIRLEEPCIITLRLYHYVGSNERENLNIATLIRECKDLGDIGRRRSGKSMISDMMETRHACLCGFKEVPGARRQLKLCGQKSWLRRCI